eukprot:6175157-Pleurochrysis_carterae.AAC.1
MPKPEQRGRDSYCSCYSIRAASARVCPLHCPALDGLREVPLCVGHQARCSSLGLFQQFVEGVPSSAHLPDQHQAARNRNVDGEVLAHVQPSLQPFVSPKLPHGRRLEHLRAQQGAFQTCSKRSQREAALASAVDFRARSTRQGSARILARTEWLHAVAKKANGIDSILGDAFPRAAIDKAKSVRNARRSPCVCAYLSLKATMYDLAECAYA